MKKALLFLSFLITFSACKENSSDPDPVITTEAFTEGKIAVTVTIPGHPLGELLQKIDPAKGDIGKQMEELAKKLTPAEQAKIEAFNEENPMFMLQLIFMPIKSVIYCKGTESTAKYDALTYHGENRVNLKTNSGQTFLQSHADKTNAVSYTYTKADLAETDMQASLNAADYNIEKTKETEVVAGYVCTKSIYTLKNVEPTPSPGDFEDMSAKPLKVEVWTSEKMPKSVNFVHPLYVEETGGIMKISVYHTPKKDIPIVYKFEKVELVAVSDAEMAIQKTDPVYDYAKDAAQLGFRILAIMLGGMEME